LSRSIFEEQDCSSYGVKALDEKIMSENITHSSYLGFWPLV